MAVSGCLVALFILYLIQAILVDAQDGAPFQLRISCGSNKNIASHFVAWTKDFGYSGGSSSPLPTSSVNALFPDLTTLRYFRQSDGNDNCYNISVPVGHYFFRFYFAYGNKDNSIGEPQFDVSLEGTLTYQLKAGWSKLLDTTVDSRYSDSLVYVGDGAATACFHNSGHGNPSVATFEILQVKNGSYSWGTDELLLKTIKRTSCGSPNTGPKFNYSADPWGGNRYWTRDDSIDGETGIDTLITSQPINNTNMDPYYFPEALFQSARVTKQPGIPLTYTYQVLSGQNYSIWLHFAEISPDITEAGQRVFDVSVNGENLFDKSVDIIEIVREPYSALFLNETVLINGNTLTLTFTPVVGTVLVSGFEIYQVVPTDYVTRAEEVWALQSLKKTLKIPTRLGWNGDPCAPAQHTWDGIDCEGQTDAPQVISTLALDNRGLKGSLSGDIEQLTSLKSLNFSHNMIVGKIPPSLGNISALTSVDLSYNLFSGPIPATLGRLPFLQTLYLNGNHLSGEVPEALGANAIEGGRFNFSDNPSLCGPGFSPCSRGMSFGAKAGVAIATILGAFALVCFIFCCWKRRQNIARSQRLMLSYDAPYAKSRTSRSAVPDIQLSRTSPEEFQFHSMYSNPPPR